MALYLIVIAASASLAIVQASFVRALPAPWSGLELPLLLLTALIMRLRTNEAFVAAFVAGIVADALSSFAPGTRTLLSLLVALGAAALATRVFSHRSFFGVVGITSAAYLLQRAGMAGIRTVRAFLDGTAYAAPDAAPIFLGLLLQLAAAVVVMLVARFIAKTFTRIFFFR